MMELSYRRHQIGAAIGRGFSYPLLRVVADHDEPALRAALAQLEEAELTLLYLTYRA
jgi:hypothetical protein